MSTQNISVLQQDDIIKHRLHELAFEPQRISFFRSWMVFIEKNYGEPSGVKIYVDDVRIELEIIVNKKIIESENVKKISKSGAGNLTYNFSSSEKVLVFIRKLPFSSRKKDKKVVLIQWDGEFKITFSSPTDKQYFNAIRFHLSINPEGKNELEIFQNKLNSKAKKLSQALKHGYKKQISFVKKNRDYYNRLIFQLKEMSPVYEELKEI